MPKEGKQATNKELNNGKPKNAIKRPHKANKPFYPIPFTQSGITPLNEANNMQNKQTNKTDRGTK